jgi:sialate O-acetylesterase
MKRSRIAAVVLLSVAIALAAAAVRADVRLPKIIGDHMVLQQDVPVPIWGWADAGEKVTVTLGKRQATATADGNGKWMVKLDALEAGGPHEMTIRGNNAITLSDVLVGEVWVASGQSNMQFSVAGSLNAQEEIAAARYPRIRLFTVARKTADQPQDDCEGSWAACTPETVPGFSAVAYFFGRCLHRELKVPVGLINTSWGGTPAEAWTSLDAQQGNPVLQPTLDRWNRQISAYDPEVARQRYEKALAAWKKAAEKAKAEGSKPPRRPNAPSDPSESPHRPANLYNGMIAPLLPFAIRGAIWYQGESNCSRAGQYLTLFPTMIRNWRQKWDQGDFPFLFVQLAPYRYGGADPRNCAELRETQRLTLDLVPNTGMAVTTDVGNVKDIHPKNKQEVGKRLALWALANTYGEKLVYSGPLYDGMSVEGDKIRIRFKHTGGGLVAKGGPLTHFTIAGKEGQFVPAEATIDGATVVVHSDQVAEPVAVRFGWADDAEPNLFNKEGLPASPFRTDDFEMVTAGNR